MRTSDRNQAHDELLAVIRTVRRRWRIRRLLAGLAATGAVALVTGLLAVWMLDRLGDGAAAWIRAAAGSVIALAAAWLLVRPLLRRASDEQVALYLEEHEPSLEAAVLSAVDARGAGAAAGSDASDALLRRTLETAIRGVHATGDGRGIERGGLARGVAALLAVVLAGAFLGFIPGAGGRAARLLSSPRPAEAAEGVAVLVQPGNATVSRGADASVTARLRGFEAGLVELAVRAEGDSTFDHLPMAASPDGGFGYLLFDLEQRTEYYVEAAGVRSPTFVLDVAELPYARGLDLELVFPSYTGLPARTVEDGGDVAALRGTRVRVVVTPTIPVTGGGIVVDGAPPIALAPDSAAGTLAGEFTVRRDGVYHIVLDGPGGAAVEASPRYVVDAMSDGPPIVSVTKPGRDERATAIDEVYVEARAEDDYGIGVLTLHWAVNGGEERTEALYGGRGSLKEVSAGRTFYLEEYGLEPGDLVAYWVTASDNDEVDGRKRATSDIYFVQIRPFQRNFQAQEQGGQPGGEPGEGPDGDLSERQRQIIAGTFNLVRDAAELRPDAIRENLNTLALAQERLREQVDVLTQRMVARQVTRDTAFRKIAEILPLAAAEMAAAAARLRALQAGEALPSEQRALQHLQRAEAVFRDVQVSTGQQQGGGGGGATPNAEDLADLFELELDKLQDQYETVDRGGSSGPDSTRAAVDETMQRLEELARRQQREEERRRREALQGTGTAGGAAQREIAEQVEEEARRLERLSREQSNPRLGEAARRLQETAESMRRSAASGGGEQRAVEGLRDARRMLERERGEGLRRRAEDAARSADEMAREQERVGRATEEMLGASPGERQEQARRLEQRKEDQLQALDELQRELRDLAGEASAGQPDAARRLREAATAIDETRLRDKIELSRRIAGGGAQDEYVRRLEESIGEDMDELGDRLRGIGGEFRPGEGQEQAETVDRARDLSRGLESLRERTRELREQRPAGQSPGQEMETGGGFGAGAVRQYRAEARERLEEARGLRDALREQGLPTGELDDLLRGLEELTRATPYADVEELVRLQAALADQAKRVELLVRVRLAGEEGAALFLDGAGAVPPEYRDLVEAYYRSLSREDGGR